MRPRTDEPRRLLNEGVRGCRRRRQERGRGVDADAIDSEQLGSSLFEQRGDPGVERRDLGFEVARHDGPVKTATPWWPRSPGRPSASDAVP